MFTLRLTKKLTAVLTALGAFVSLSGIPAQAVVDPCAATITKAGTAAVSADVEVTNYDIYCVAKFKTVANDYAFTPPTGITKLDYLLVGGGGGGASGGGGAGGFLTASDYQVAAATPISITVGAGGSGGTGGRAVVLAANDGTSSVFGSITALGGGAGGEENIQTSNAGASGGGSRFDCTNINCGSGQAGSGNALQGNNGGYSTYNSYGAGGGGGGAGGAGFNTVRNYIGANGGIGLQSDITGTPTYYAGGGGGGINANSNSYFGLDSNNVRISSASALTNGGGQGGLGGGGRGSSYGFSGGTRGQFANATAGAPNTGGGGGGTDPEDINAGEGGSGVVIIRWVSTVNLKAITFNSNLPSGSTTATQNVAAGVASILDINTFSRTGYVFMGWTTNADGSGTAYADEGSITTATDVTLYAKWEAGVTHTVIFDANTGSGSMPTQTAGTSTSLNPNTFTKSSNTFNGWNTSADGTGFAYPEGAIYSFDSHVTMYAQWRPIVATYQVTFYGNGADGGSTATQRASSSTALNLNGFTRSGYNFLGWNTSYNAGSAQYVDGQNYAFTSDVNLYAQWVTQANNNITFDKNSVTATGTTATQTASSSTQLSANGFTNNGYTFRNWNTAANGSGTAYQANYVYSFATGITLFAQWGQNYTVTFDANGSDTGTIPGSQSSFVGSPGVNLPLNSGRLVKNGYRLAGWNTNDLGTGTPYALGASSVSFAGATVLFAQWAPAVYSVLYSGNGATAGVEPTPQTFTFGTTVAVSDNAGQLVRPGYTFEGWNTAPDGSGTTIAPAASNVALASDTVLFARWLAVASVPQTPVVEAPTPSATPTPTVTPTVTPTPTPTQSSSTLVGFTGKSTTLTTAMKAKLKLIFAASTKFNKVVVSGFTTGSVTLKANAAIAKTRAANVAAYLKSLGFKGTVSAVAGKQTSNPATRSGSAQITFTKLG